MIRFYFLRMLCIFLLLFPVALLFRFFRIRQLHRRKTGTSWQHETGVLCFLLFCAALASQTVFPDFSAGACYSLPGARSDINLSLFRVFPITAADLKNGNSVSFWINFLGNIAVFIPIGFLFPLLWRISLPKVVGICFLFSLTIETVQLFLPRTTDIDDLWLNTLGGLFGVLFYRLFRRFFFGAAEKCRTFSIIE